MHAYCVHCFFWLCHRQLENNYSTVVGAVNFSNPGTATRHFPTWRDGPAGNDKMMGACQPARREWPWMERGWNNYLVQHGRFQKTCLGAEKKQRLGLCSTHCTSSQESERFRGFCIHVLKERFCTGFVCFILQKGTCHNAALHLWLLDTNP